MLNDHNLISLIDKLTALQASVNIIAETLNKMQKDKVMLGDWMSEKEIMEATGLSRSSLLKLRNTGKVTSSSILGKQPYYKLCDFKKLLDINEQQI